MISIALSWQSDMNQGLPMEVNLIPVPGVDLVTATPGDGRKMILIDK